VREATLNSRNLQIGWISVTVEGSRVMIRWEGGTLHDLRTKGENHNLSSPMPGASHVFVGGGRLRIRETLCDRGTLSHRPWEWFGVSAREEMYRSSRRIHKAKASKLTL